MGRTAGVRVVRRVIVDAEARAKEILREAERAAQQLTESARAQLAAERERVERETEARVREEVMADWAARVLRAERAMTVAERDLVALAIEVVRAVLGQHAALSHELVEQSARRALAKVRRAQSIVLRVHPAEHALVSARARTWLVPGSEPSALEVCADEAIERGGVVVECELGRVDARLSTQIDAIARALEAS
jgi:flagellar biosynthesis/type III secretory pathway protein FliH